MDLVIYGAQGTALGACRAIRRCCPERNILCFLVSKLEGNSSVLEGVPVCEVESFAAELSRQEAERIEVLIATPENMMGEIESFLGRCGLHRHVRLDSRRWAEMMGHYYSSEGNFLPLSALPVGYTRPEVHVYMAKCLRDRPLSRDYVLPDWVESLQVGAAHCRERVAEILDCDGENISEKNGNYSELTGLYWIWKNRLQKAQKGIKSMKYSESREGAATLETYCGLAHYRRMLDLDSDDLLRLADNGVDVVLPYPMPYEPNIGEHHKRYLSHRDWEALLQALGELQPEYAVAFSKILCQKYLYNYNIILARESVLADYCSWLFPILERTEKLSIPKGKDRSDRYIGYMGESLCTLYFSYQRNKLKIVHEGCRFLM